jgi:hypothetical protein
LGKYERNERFMKYLIIFSITLTSLTHANGELQKAREYYYKSVEDETYLDSAKTIFEKRWHQNKQPIDLTYLGALDAVTGKHSVIPWKKYTSVIAGLEKMDEAVALDSTNIEIRFIRASLCYYLPFFFERGETVTTDFKAILRHYRQTKNDYPFDLRQNMLAFINSNGKLSAKDKQLLLTLMREEQNAG